MKFCISGVRERTQSIFVAVINRLGITVGICGELRRSTRLRFRGDRKVTRIPTVGNVCKKLYYS